MFVPVPARRLRAALADPARVARAVPGLQQDSGAEPVAGRLKVRVGSHSVTYRGTLRVSARDDGTYGVEGVATESRGTGSVDIALTIRLRDTDDGSALAFDGTASAAGRLTELAPDAVRAAVIRLLNRFAENLAAEPVEPAVPAEPTEPTVPAESAEPTEPLEPAESAEPTEPLEPAESAEALATEDFAPLATGDFEATPDADDAPVPPPEEAPGPSLSEPGSAEHVSVFDTEVPPSSLDPLAEDDGYEADAAEAGEADEEDGGEDQPDRDDEDMSLDEDISLAEGFDDASEPPAEAAHARRTMIGRSAEEVDHAPPRGRYAPVPAPLTVSATPTLRWAAPAAALVVASAIVVGRALRRRR